MANGNKKEEKKAAKSQLTSAASGNVTQSDEDYKLDSEAQDLYDKMAARQSHKWPAYTAMGSGKNTQMVRTSNVKRMNVQAMVNAKNEALSRKRDATSFEYQGRKFSTSDYSMIPSSKY